MEKMKVLQMLEEGKITADEAARLIQAVDNPKKYTHTQSSTSTEAPRTPHASYGSQNPPPGYETVSEFGRKIETFARDIEPKLAKFTETVVEKTANMADRISKSISEASRPAPPPPPAERERYESRPAPVPPRPAPPRPAPSRPASAPPATGGLNERSFELIVLAEYNELSMAALNGDVLIKGYNGDKITARVSWRAKRHNAPIELMKFGNKYYLNYDEDEFEKVIIDAYVPESMFNRVNIRTVNGRIDISTLKCDYLSASTSNSEAIIRNVEADDTSIECDNSRITVSNISGTNGRIENFNGMVQAELLDISNLKMSTFNAPINVSIANFNRYSDYSWTIETNNGKLNLNLPTHPLLGYALKAQNTLGDIKIGLTGLNYSVNLPTQVEATSIDFSDAHRKIVLSMETSNAPLIVN